METLIVDLTPEPEKLAEPGEYKVTIVSAQLKHSMRTDSPYIALRLRVHCDEDVNDVYTNLMLPMSDSSSSSRRMYKLIFRAFCDCMGIEHDGQGVKFDVDDLVNRSGWVLLDIESGEFNGNVYERNRVAKWLPARA